MFDLTIDNILLLIGTLQGLFLAIVAGFKKKGYKWSNIFLSLFIFNYTFDGPILSFIFSDPFYKDLFWYFPLPAKYSVIPFLILYIGSIYQKPRVIRKSILILLFLPSLIELLCSLFFFIHHLIFPENTVNTNLIEDFYFFLITYFLILFNLFLLVYLYKWMLNKNKLLSKDDTSKILWLRNIVAYFIFIQIVEASLFILNQLSIIVFFDSYIFILIIFELVFITYISLRGFYHADLLSKFKTTIKDGYSFTIARITVSNKGLIYFADDIFLEHSDYSLFNVIGKPIEDVSSISLDRTTNPVEIVDIKTYNSSIIQAILLNTYGKTINNTATTLKLVFIVENGNSIYQLTDDILRITTNCTELHSIFALTTELEDQEYYLLQGLKVDYLAEQLSVTKHRFTKLVSLYTRKGYIDYINNLRLEYFFILYLSQNNPTLSLVGLASRAGFRSKTTFYQFFKKQIGSTPSAFVKSLSRHN